LIGKTADAVKFGRGRTVVDDHDLPVLIRLPRYGLQRLPQQFAAVKVRNNDTYQPTDHKMPTLPATEN
jgi:hypothetical protein